MKEKGSQGRCDSTSYTMSRTTTIMTPTSNDRGVKRPPDDSLDDEQRFTKRFNLLNISQSQLLLSRRRITDTAFQVDNPSKLYIPVPTTSDNDSHYSSTSIHPSRPSTDKEDTMHLDDTPDKIYIHDLEAELASLAPEPEERLIFLPDIERALARLPKQVFIHPSEAARGSQGKELVLYGPGGNHGEDSDEETEDLVRRAIGETKARARREWRERNRQVNEGEGVETAHGFEEGEYGHFDGQGMAHTTRETEVDEDAMDIE